MRSIGAYMLGYLLLMGGVVLALWKLGILDAVAPFWILVGALVVLGVGVMIAVSHRGRRGAIEIDSR